MIIIGDNHVASSLIHRNFALVLQHSLGSLNTRPDVPMEWIYPSQ